MLFSLFPKIDALKTDWRSVFPDREQNEVAGPEMSRQQGEAADLLLGLRVWRPVWASAGHSGGHTEGETEGETGGETGGEDPSLQYQVSSTPSQKLALYYL